MRKRMFSCLVLALIALVASTLGSPNVGPVYASGGSARLAFEPVRLAHGAVFTPYGVRLATGPYYDPNGGSVQLALGPYYVPGGGSLLYV